MNPYEYRFDYPTYWEPSFYTSLYGLPSGRHVEGKRCPKKYRKKERNRTDPRNSR